MNGLARAETAYFHSDLEEQLDILAVWDVDALVDALGITTDDILQVDDFKHRAEQWIKDNQL